MNALISAVFIFLYVYALSEMIFQYVHHYKHFQNIFNLINLQATLSPINQAMDKL